MNARQRSYYLRARRVMALVHDMPALPKSEDDWYPVHVEAAKLRLERLENAQDSFAAAGKARDADFLTYSILSVARRIERAIPLVEARRARMLNITATIA